MLENAKVCFYPKSPKDAVRILKDKGKQALILAGGTTAALNRDRGITTLVDLTRMGQDKIVKSGDEWSIGCGVRVQELGDHSGLSGLFDRMLVDAACSVGSRPIRNATTIGGNAVQLFRWSDPPVALLAMNAIFDLVGPEGERSLESDAFFARHPRQVLGEAEVLTQIRIREPDGVYGGAFTKYARTAFDLAVVDAAVCLWFEQAKCIRARVAVGGTRTVPWRSTEAEKRLIGKRLNRKHAAEAGAAARGETKTADDIRTSEEYRLQMVEVIVRRTIERAIGHAKEKS
jgi:aerobic carbon-monoxide dehydrogenase medium subunit